MLCNFTHPASEFCEKQSSFVPYHQACMLTHTHTCMHSHKCRRVHTHRIKETQVSIDSVQFSAMAVSQIVNSLISVSADSFPMCVCVCESVLTDTVTFDRHVQREGRQIDRQMFPPHERKVLVMYCRRRNSFMVIYCNACNSVPVCVHVVFRLCTCYLKTPFSAHSQPFSVWMCSLCVQRDH